MDFGSKVFLELELEDVVLFWGLFVFAVVAAVLLAGVLRWALTDPDADQDIAKERFESEQDWRALRRSGKL